MTTDDTLERARRGDRAAVEVLLADLAPRIHRFGLRLCGNAHDADDVLQDTLLNVAQHLGEFEGRSSLSTWVFALTRNACARRRRGFKNAPPAEGEKREQHDLGPSPEASAAQQELVDGVIAALETLPVEAREVLLLRDVEGLSAAEAAAALELSVDALKSRLHRARVALRERLKPLLEPDLAAAPAGCPDVMTLWSRKLEDELSQADCRTMEAHIETCAACRGACDALKRALVACNRAGTTPLPVEVQHRVRGAVRAWVSRRSADDSLERRR